MRGSLASVVIAAALLVACGSPEELAPESLASTSAAPLTSTDVDVAPECQGVINFANNASFATLDAYLPSDLASNIVGARAVTPFTTLASLSSVFGMGAVRLTQTYQGALAEGYVTSSCVGIFDELAVSTDDQARMVALVNSISDTEMHDIMPNAWNGAVNLLAGRPYTSVAGISGASGIGTVSLRSIRNAATLTVPFETLATAVNNLHRDARVLRHFDWYTEMTTAWYGYYLWGMTCFGINPDWLPQGVEIRPNLATAAEVYAEVSSTVSFANRYNQLTINPAIGLANLNQQLQGKSFFGCYISYADDPWSGNNLAFFVDPVTGLGVLSETWWSE